MTYYFSLLPMLSIFPFLVSQIGYKETGNSSEKADYIFTIEQQYYTCNHSQDSKYKAQVQFILFILHSSMSALNYTLKKAKKIEIQLSRYRYIITAKTTTIRAIIIPAVNWAKYTPRPASAIMPLPIPINFLSC